MRIWLIILLSAMWLPSSAADLSFEPTDLHEHYQFTTFTVRLKVTNNIGSAIHLAHVEALRKNDRIIEAPDVVEAGSSAYIVVEIGSDDDAGPGLHAIRVATAEGDPQVVRLRNFGISVLDNPRPSVDLRVFNVGEHPKWFQLQLGSPVEPDLRIVSIVQTPDFVTARIGVNGTSLEVAANPRAGWGFHQGFVRVALNSPVQKLAAVRVQLDVHGNIVPSENPLVLGIVRKRIANATLLTLKSTTGRDFDIDSIKFSGLAATATASACTPAAKGCRLLAISLDDAQPTGRVNGEMLIGLKHSTANLVVGLTGVLVEPETKIIPLDLSAAQSDPANNRAVDLKSALGKVTQRPDESAVAVPAGTGPLLKWRVENEGQLHGYFVFRGEHDGGPYQRATTEAIPADPSLEASTQALHYWRDTEAISGKTYWYYIVTISLDGRMQQLTGPQKVIAK